MEMEQFSRFTLEKEMLNRIRGTLTPEQEEAYRFNIESYRQLDPERREIRMLDLDNAFHRMAFTLCGMEEHFDHMLSTFQHMMRASRPEQQISAPPTPASWKPCSTARRRM